MMKIESSAFSHQGEIPSHHTSDGEDASPPLQISDVPADAKSLALIVDDPDAPDPAAPKMTWVHWVLYDLPPTTINIGMKATAAQLDGRDGNNDWRRVGYGGPAPPIGRHRYFFKLFALDTMLGDLHNPTKHKLEQAMAGHVLARAELVGTYARQSGGR
jgi:Raf kinase inhibitor-like YbhB/YbcL family protein